MRWDVEIYSCAAPLPQPLTAHKFAPPDPLNLSSLIFNALPLFLETRNPENSEVQGRVNSTRRYVIILDTIIIIINNYCIIITTYIAMVRRVNRSISVQVYSGRVTKIAKIRCADRPE